MNGIKSCVKWSKTKRKQFKMYVFPNELMWMGLQSERNLTKFRELSSTFKDSNTSCGNFMLNGTATLALKFSLNAVMSNVQSNDVCLQYIRLKTQKFSFFCF